jgi:hypothetical protein
MNVTQHVNALAKRANPRIRQQMLTVPITRVIPALGSQDGLGLEATAYLKFFGGGRGTWYATEASPVYADDARATWPLATAMRPEAIVDITFFGYVVSALGEDYDELGYFGLLELAQLQFPPFGLPIERDQHFEPTVLRDELATRWGVAA